MVCRGRAATLVVDGRDLDQLLSPAVRGIALLAQGRFYRLREPAGDAGRLIFDVPEDGARVERSYQLAWRGTQGGWRTHPAPIFGCLPAMGADADALDTVIADGEDATSDRTILGALRLVDAPGGLAPASGLSQDAFLQRIRAAGYQETEVRTLAALGLTVATIPVPPARDVADALADLEAAVPEAIFAPNDRYAAASGGRVYARALMAGDPTCRINANGVSFGLLDGPVAAAPLSAAFPLAELATWWPAGVVGGDVGHASSIAHLLLDGAHSGIRLDVAAVLSGEGERLGADALTIAAGVDWLTGRAVDLIVAPLAGPGNPVLEAALQGAAAEGVLFVAAVGNAGPDRPVSFPAASRWAFAVSAIDADGAPYSRANRGPEVFAAAPGVDLWTPDYSAEGPTRAGGRYWTGSSFATPMAALALAQWIAERPRDDRRGLGALTERRRLARAAAAAARDLYIPGRDPATGWGLLRLVKCVGG